MPISGVCRRRARPHHSQDLWRLGYFTQTGSQGSELGCVLAQSGARQAQRDNTVGLRGLTNPAPPGLSRLCPGPDGMPHLYDGENAVAAHPLCVEVPQELRFSLLALELHALPACGDARVGFARRRHADARMPRD